MISERTLNDRWAVYREKSDVWFDLPAKLRQRTPRPLEPSSLGSDYDKEHRDPNRRRGIVGFPWFNRAAGITEWAWHATGVNPGFWMLDNGQRDGKDSDKPHTHPIFCGRLPLAYPNLHPADEVDRLESRYRYKQTW
jgi:hypothetical protein